MPYVVEQGFQKRFQFNFSVSSEWRGNLQQDKRAQCLGDAFPRCPAPARDFPGTALLSPHKSPWEVCPIFTLAHRTSSSGQSLNTLGSELGHPKGPSFGAGSYLKLAFQRAETVE